MARMRYCRVPIAWHCLTWLAGLGTSQAAVAKVWTIPASEHVEYEAQEAILNAKPGDVIQLPPGRFSMTQGLSMTTPFLTLRGAGMDQTTLVYDANAEEPQAIISYAGQVVFEDFALENHPGDGIKVIGADGVTMRRVKVEWTRRGTAENGAYGLYPVESSNILLEDNVVIGASDAGIYVGQSHDIIVRRNRVEYNVAGIEIENSKRADVYDNDATHNSGGILVFKLPNLMVQDGRGTRIFNNQIHDNNFKNFAPKGNTVAALPQGTGILIMANDEVEVFANRIEQHNTSSISIVSYHITQKPVPDSGYDATPEKIWIHDNVLRKAGGRALVGGNQVGLVATALSFPHRVPHIIYDGLGLPDGKGGYHPAELSEDQRICIGPNDHDGGRASFFGNLQLWKQRWWSPLPGAMNRDGAPHRCVYPAFSGVSLASPPPLPEPDPQQPSEEEALDLCQRPVEGIHWQAAASVDCPLLSQYQLFADPRNPLSEPRDGGLPYELTSALFSDYASKSRVLFLPPGTSARYQGEQSLDLPRGTIIAKTFYFPADLRQPESPRKLVETRLLIHREKGWAGLTYRWHEDGTATRIRGGYAERVAWLDRQGRSQSNNYRIPNLAQCTACHLNGAPIGLRPGYVNRNGTGALAELNQLEAWSAQGRLSDRPETDLPRYPDWSDATASLDTRARTYLDINCAHCHSASGKANSSALFLNIDQPLDVNAGLCKPPVAAGQASGSGLVDIFPGHPEKSILVARLNSTKAAVKMPEVAKSMVHSEGVVLISDWIKALPGTCP